MHGCISTGDATKDQTSPEAMLCESALRLSSTVEALDNLAMSVDNLGFYIRSKTGE